MWKLARSDYLAMAIDLNFIELLKLILWILPLIEESLLN